MTDARSEKEEDPYDQLPRQNMCPKCGAYRDHERWPHGILYFNLDAASSVNHLELEGHLLVMCTRCQYRWAEPPGDIKRVKEVEHVG
ncbi:hypothetical protein LCGC14_1665100 [marine sediment metagenome]|uniref:Uncharacterized protein n=1 Tax=marine sediment metagenome TaxID=412755 RepID=A0A0F9IFJ1_9ZZZZ